MNLEQRICLRQTLGAAQEAFDPASVIADLKLLAQERDLDIENPSHVETLIRDMPAKVQQRRRDLLTLARWDSSMVDKVGESPNAGSDTIGLDKIKGLTRIVDAVKKHHPVVYKRLGADKGLTKKLGTMYLDRKFSHGTRSQEAIRKVTAGITALDTNDPDVQRYLEHELPYDVMANFAPAKSAKDDIESVCKQLVQLLLKADSSKLSSDELSILKRSNVQIINLLQEAGNR
jgi:hypothetical protein